MKKQLNYNRKNNEFCNIYKIHKRKLYHFPLHPSVFSRYIPSFTSLVIRHFFPFPVSTFPFEGSQRLLGMCTARAESVIRGWFVSFSSLSPFGGSGAYRINNSPHSLSLRKSARDFHHIFFVIRLSSLVISLFFPSHFPLVPMA